MCIYVHTPIGSLGIYVLRGTFFLCWGMVTPCRIFTSICVHSDKSDLSGADILSDLREVPT